eukprot:TRINITY_DN38370_c0_g1_i1.p1 TRINITY_DN38370_c0_g1~~TRINITY_DN38370_c0_g1_i1.p1  ORF type:complete len:116 (-),score=26.15 TRINITY_DN38370_c0_g1_i1:47-394(-)
MESHRVMTQNFLELTSISIAVVFRLSCLAVYGFLTTARLVETLQSVGLQLLVETLVELAASSAEVKYLGLKHKGYWEYFSRQYSLTLIVGAVLVVSFLFDHFTVLILRPILIPGG